MKKKSVSILGCVLFFITCMSIKVGAGVVDASLAKFEKSASYKIDVKDNRLSVDVNKAPLSEVIATIEKKTGIEFKVDSSMLKKLIDVGFKNIPLLEGVRLIVYPSNMFCVYAENDTLEKVIILPATAGKQSGMVISAGKKTRLPHRPIEKEEERDKFHPGLRGGPLSKRRHPGSSPSRFKGPPSGRLSHPPKPPGLSTMSQRPPMGGEDNGNLFSSDERPPSTGGPPPVNSENGPPENDEEKPPIGDHSDGPVQ